jgi:hypothetical protein
LGKKATANRQQKILIALPIRLILLPLPPQIIGCKIRLIGCPEAITSEKLKIKKDAFSKRKKTRCD